MNEMDVRRPGRINGQLDSGVSRSEITYPDGLTIDGTQGIELRKPLAITKQCQPERPIACHCRRRRRRPEQLIGPLDVPSQNIQRNDTVYPVDVYNALR